MTTKTLDKEIEAEIATRIAAGEGFTFVVAAEAIYHRLSDDERYMAAIDRIRVAMEAYWYIPDAGSPPRW